MSEAARRSDAANARRKPTRLRFPLSVRDERALQGCVTRVGRGIPRLRFKRIVLIVPLRHDESCGFPTWLELAKAGLMMPLKSYHRSGKYLFLPQLSLYWRELTPVCCQFDDPQLLKDTLRGWLLESLCA